MNFNNDRAKSCHSNLEHSLIQKDLSSLSLYFSPPTVNGLENYFSYSVLLFYFFTLLFIKLNCFCSIHEFSSSPGVGVGCCFATVSPAGHPAQLESIITFQNLRGFKLCVCVCVEGVVVLLEGFCVAFFVGGTCWLWWCCGVYFIPTPGGRNVLNVIGFYPFLHCYINTFPYQVKTTSGIYGSGSKKICEQFEGQPQIAVRRLETACFYVHVSIYMVEMSMLKFTYILEFLREINPVLRQHFSSFLYKPLCRSAKQFVLSNDSD